MLHTSAPALQRSMARFEKIWAPALAAANDNANAQGATRSKPLEVHCRLPSAVCPALLFTHYYRHHTANVAA